MQMVAVKTRTKSCRICTALRSSVMSCEKGMGALSSRFRTTGANGGCTNQVRW